MRKFIQLEWGEVCNQRCLFSSDVDWALPLRTTSLCSRSTCQLDFLVMEQEKDTIIRDKEGSQRIAPDVILSRIVKLKSTTLLFLILDASATFIVSILSKHSLPLFSTILQYPFSAQVLTWGKRWVVHNVMFSNSITCFKAKSLLKRQLRKL